MRECAEISRQQRLRTVGEKSRVGAKPIIRTILFANKKTTPWMRQAIHGVWRGTSPHLGTI